GDRVTLMSTTPDGSLNAVDGIVAGLADVRIKELNDRYLAAGTGLVWRLLQSPEAVSKLVVFLSPRADEQGAARALGAALRKAGCGLEGGGVPGAPGRRAGGGARTGGGLAQGGL